MPHSRLIALSRDFIKEQHGLVAPLPVSEEEANPVVPEDMQAHAYSLEATTSTIEVGYDLALDSCCSDFRFFEDGRQRTLQIGHIPAEHGGKMILLPVHYFVVAAVILERDGRKLKLWGSPIIRQGIFVAESLVHDQDSIAQFREAGLEIVSTEGKGRPGDDYYDLKRRALNTGKDQRLSVEQELISQWRDAVSDEDFLVVDGTLMNLRDAESEKRCVGISKSFTARYFEVATHNRILQMPAGHRSWVFRFHEPDNDFDDQRLGARDRLSWYLRLRAGTHGDPEFGLIRVEISKAYADDATAFADKLSRWLLSDRLPTAYPSPRWDKHLYPIRACENYLSSIVPSLSTITAGVKG